MSTTPGWYHDPNVPGQLRYFDGTTWTEHVQPDPTNLTIQQVVPPPASAYPSPAASYQAQSYTAQDHGAPQFQQQQQPVLQHYQPVQQVQVNQITMAAQPQKSVGVAFLLAFLFGPFGLFYATVVGGIVMTVLTFTLGILFFPFLFLFWPIEMIWACVAAANRNKAGAPMVNVTGATPMAAQQPAQQPAQHQAQPQYPQTQYPPAALPQSTGPDPFVGQPTQPTDAIESRPPGSTWYS